MQKEHFGLGSISKLKPIIDEHNPRAVFLVTGKTSFEKSGARLALDRILLGRKTVHFSDFESNPKMEDIQRGIKEFKQGRCDFVIAVGGGSVMDVAKSINIFSNNANDPIDMIKGKEINNKGKPLVAIPTTSGSGSEATKFAVVYTGYTKHSLDHKFILPDFAIIDPSLTIRMPKRVAAASGMDALCQGIESYWCINSTEESKKHARKAIKLALENIDNAVNNPDKKSRKNMMLAAHLAGKAINISRTTSCHAISYPITSFFNVPHGHAVALTIGEMIRFNYQVTEENVSDRRGAKYVKDTISQIVSMLGTENTYEASEKLKVLMKEIGLETRLSELGIKAEDMEIIINNGFNPDRVKNNPRLLTKKDLRSILEEIS